MDFTNAIKRPFTDLKKFLIGCVLYLIPIVNFFVIGYSLECARLTFKKKNNLPDWTKWGDLFMHGLLSVVIGIIYVLPAAILAVIGFTMMGGMGIITGMMTQSPLAILPAIMASAPIFILAAIVGLFTVYLLYAALLSYAKNFKFSDALAFGIIFKKAFTGHYFLAWIVSLIIGIVLMALLSWIPVVGGTIAGFINLIFGITLMAEAYSKQ